MRGLVEHGAIGLLTTHDLALADIATTLEGRALNVHFEDHIENGAIRFDYHLRSGIVTRSNALELMRAVKLDVLECPESEVRNIDGCGADPLIRIFRGEKTTCR